ncbi:hypothetical protein KK062_19875 [Fulvivirgaceae bacterium PWU5]|uniref:Uncharacterized protein n=1 Tax=Dawidia cretensis TaxID=2782350 RepID=A0AAP2DZX3_9BACT|nr:bestrophin family ion channel [Dawidia cretensis]MBT1710513.1 hypothetical protein [Dawidia cretensis]
MLLKNKIPLTYALGKIRKEIVLVTAYAVLIALIYDKFHFTRISIPLSVPMVMVTVLSLLLAFKSNQAYDRWWEARTIWGAIVNESRTLARQITTMTYTEYDTEALDIFRDRFVKRQIAWAYVLGQSLRGARAFKGLEDLLVDTERHYIERYDNKSFALLELHGRDLNFAMRKKWLNKYQQVEIDGTVTRLCNAMGQCERIKNTVFPSTYSLYIRFAMYFFIILLPFALIEMFGLMEIPMVVGIASSYLLIEKMAIHLQDPFENRPTDTPVTAIAATIERDLRQALNDLHSDHHQSLADQGKEHDYYIM